MITVVGSASIDLIATVTQLPASGETLLATGFSRQPGGKGANQAVAAARAGSTVHLVASLGDDPHGREMLDALQAASINTEAVTIQPDIATGLAMIAVDRNGENQIVVVAGANGLLTAEQVAESRGVIARSDVVLLQLEVPLQATVAAAELAQKAGATVILNPSPAGGFDQNLLYLADVLVLNVPEVVALTHLDDPVDPAFAARMLLDGELQAVILTRGEQGAVVITEEISEEIPAFAVPSVDGTGAGDAFIGNLAHGLEQGQPLLEATRFACAAGALATTQSGAMAAMPVLEDTLALLKEHPLS